MERFQCSHFGCIVLVDSVPNLFIKSNGVLMDGMPLYVNEDNLYVYIEKNEMVVVGLKIEDNFGIEINADDLTPDNINEFEYKISPLHIYELKTMGLIFDDILDFDILNLVFNKVMNIIFNEE